MVSIYHLKAIYREHVPRMRLLTRVSRRIYHGYIALKTRRLTDHFIDRNGLRFQFDSGNLIERQMATAGYWEEDTTHFIERFVKPGMSVAEVGANIGAHTLPIAARLMDGGRITAFEPTDWAHGRLLENLRLNPQLKNIAVEKSFVADVTEPIQTRATSFWTVDGVGNNTSFYEIVPIRLDDYFAHHDRLDILKIDVDGADHKVIKGAKQVIERCSPIIYVEVGHGLREFGSSVDALLADLTGMGYSLSAYDYRAKSFRPIDVSQAAMKLQKQPVINVLAVKGELSGVGPLRRAYSD